MEDLATVMTYELATVMTYEIETRHFYNIDVPGWLYRIRRSDGQVTRWSNIPHGSEQVAREYGELALDVVLNEGGCKK